MTLSQIEVFIKVIQLKSFTRAGEELGMTQSAVSHSILKLEDHFGTKLIERNKKTFLLTPIGEKIYENMKLIMKNVSLINSQITEIKKLPKKTLRLGGYQGSSISFLSKIIREFQLVFPEIDIVLFEGTHDELLEWLESEIIDLALIVYPNENYYMEYLFQDELKVIFHKNHFLKNNDYIKMKDLKNENFITMKEYSNTQINEYNKINGLNLNIKYRVTNLITVLKMIKENIGITIMPSFIFYNKSSYEFQKELIMKSLTPSIYLKVGYASKFQISNDIVKQTFIEKAKQIINIYAVSEK